MILQKNRFLLLHCDGDNCNVFQSFPQKNLFFLGFKMKSKLYKSSIPNKHGVILILVKRNSIVISDENLEVGLE